MDTTKIFIAKQLYRLVLDWRWHAGRYLFFARFEDDALGKKFYESVAMGYGNAATELENRLNDLALADQIPLGSSMKPEDFFNFQKNPAD